MAPEAASRPKRRHRRCRRGAASATMTPRRWPNRSAIPPISGVATTLAQIAAAKTSAISGASRPRPASHTGQNGGLDADDEKARRIERAEARGGCRSHALRHRRLYASGWPRRCRGPCLCRGVLPSLNEAERADVGGHHRHRARRRQCDRRRDGGGRTAAGAPPSRHPARHRARRRRCASCSPLSRSNCCNA